MSKKSLILVILQFSCFAFFAIDGVFTSKSWLFYLQIVGFIIAVWGVLVMKLGNFNVQPEVKSTAKMVSKGPYKIIRNPMYTGLLIFFSVTVISKFTFVRLGVFAILTVVLLLKIFMEEKFLEQKFRETYLNYKSNTYRLIPFVY